VIASSSTVQASPGVDADPAGAQEVKGRTEPVEIYRLVPR
jgi:class 3 adenylate cyclase